MEYLDTRDLQKRLDELEGVIEDYMEEKELEELDNESNAFEDWVDYEELLELREMADEIPEWQYGETLIPEDEFVDYCEELCKDVGDLPSEIPWYIEIDWEKTAENIRVDYSECKYQGTTYLYRA